MSSRFLIGIIFVGTLIAGGGCMLSPVSEKTSGPPDVDTGNKEQAETAIVAATDPVGFPKLVTTYNDYSIGRTFAGENEFRYPLIGPGGYGGTRIIHRGASLLGWATSLDGQTWSYHGKVHPPRELPYCTYDTECPSGSCQDGTCTCATSPDCGPSVECNTLTNLCESSFCAADAECPAGFVCSVAGTCNEEPWATIFGDPSMATDESSPNLVYAVNLGVSDASYDSVPNGGASPNAEPRIDGFCIARSFDGGSSFGVGPDEQHFLQREAYCQRVVPAGPPSDTADIDKTAVVVDWKGRVWVATEDRANQTMAVFHSIDNARNWNQFVRIRLCTGAASDRPDCIPQQQAQFLGEYEPILRASPRCEASVSPDCAVAPNAYGNVQLETVHFSADQSAHIETLNFGPGYDPSVTPTSCTLPTDCASGICTLDGICGCVSDADCDVRFQCNTPSQKCVARSCATDADCNGGWVCDAQVCSQPSSWDGFDLTSQCAITNVWPQPVLAVYGIDNPGDGPQDGSHSLRGAFRHSFDIGYPRTGGTVYRFAYLYMQADTSQMRVQVAEFDGETCSVPPMWSTENIAAGQTGQAATSQEFWPTIDWTERSQQPLVPGALPELEWQLGYLSNRFVVDQDKRYVLPYGSTVTRNSVGVPLLQSDIPLVWPGDNGSLFGSFDSYLCARPSGYWGDYFGLTQFPGTVSLPFFVPQPYWLNAATFTFSAHRSANAGPVCTVEGNALGQPMSVYGFTWPSIEPP